MPLAISPKVLLVHHNGFATLVGHGSCGGCGGINIIVYQQLARYVRLELPPDGFIAAGGLVKRTGAGAGVGRPWGLIGALAQHCCRDRILRGIDLVGLVPLVIFSWAFRH